MGRGLEKVRGRSWLTAKHYHILNFREKSSSNPSLSNLGFFLKRNLCPSLKGHGYTGRD